MWPNRQNNFDVSQLEQFNKHITILFQGQRIYDYDINILSTTPPDI